MTLADVIVKIWADCELAVASFDGACKRFYALMKAQVLPEMRRLCVRLPTDLTEVHAWPGRCLMASPALTDRWLLRLRDTLRSFRYNIAFWLLDMLLVEMLDEQGCCQKNFWNALLASEGQLVALVVDSREIVVLLVSVDV